MSLPRCTLARVGCAFVSADSHMICACGVVEKCLTPEAAADLLVTHRERGRENAWTVPSSHERGVR